MRNEIVIYILGIFLLFFILDCILEITKKRKIVYLIFFFIYLLFLYLCLFDRTMNQNKMYSDGTYIKEWIKILFQNKVVFKNIVGNILIFIPMGVFIKRLPIKCFCHFIVACSIAISIIIGIETLQYITQIGIFDIMDIILNLIGFSIGYVVVKKRGGKNE